MRVGVFGGSFDPVHLGHLALGESCWRQAQLDRVVFVPTAQQPLKPSGPIAPADERLAMLRLATDGRQEFSISTIELDRGGVSYSVDTLRQLHDKRPEDKMFFLMGADSLAEFPSWREPEEICRLATPIVVRRAGTPEPDFDSLVQVLPTSKVAEIRAAQVEMPPMPISSSQIRSLVAEGGPWHALVPAPVARYIEERGLYRRP
jgi:nicotinate-nucleotide adenylyltransferase